MASVGSFACAVMMMAPGIKKGPVTGPWGFTGYGSPAAA